MLQQTPEGVEERPMWARAPFITFEGPEGSGKTTQIRLLAQDLASMGVPHVVTKEPGGTHMADEIRTTLLARREETVYPETEILLYLASRSQHVRGLILPALLEGRAVLCDRYVDSTVAYQGHGRGLDIDTILSANHVATGGLAPTRTILFDLPVEEGLARAGARGEMNRLDAESLSFHQRVREGFLSMARSQSCRFHVIDASRDVDSVRNAVREAVMPILRKACA